VTVGSAVSLVVFWKSSYAGEGVGGLGIVIKWYLHRGRKKTKTESIISSNTRVVAVFV